MATRRVTAAALLRAVLGLRSLFPANGLSPPSPSGSCFRQSSRPESETSADDRRRAVACQRLLSVGLLLQSDLYSTAWFDGATQLAKRDDERTPEGGVVVVAARRIRPGEVLALYPFHAVGLREPLLVQEGGAPNRALGPTSWFWKDEDLMDFQRVDRSRSMRESISNVDDPFWGDAVLQLDVNVERPTVRGWFGHLVPKTSTSDDKGNCVLVPLVLPVCGLVATKSIAKGTRLKRLATVRPNSVQDWATKSRALHPGPFAELQAHLSMAYAPPPVPNTSSDLPKAFSANDLRHPFHDVDRSYPGMVALHTDPDVLLIENFLTEDMCDRLVAKAQPHMAPSLVKNEGTGAVEQDASRTSTDTNIPQREIPSIVKRIVALANCTPEQLEIFQILRYTKGQYFLPHTDGFQGPTTACGFERSGRLVTIFCYLNDVPAGGASNFPLLNVSVPPRKGSAVVHFPTTTGFEEDPRTEHEGSIADSEKWLLATWVWNDTRTDVAYAEANLPMRNDDII